MARSHRSVDEIPGKEPWLAVNLSRIFPGLGQIYAGQTVKGYGIAIAIVLFTLVGGWLLLSPTGDARTGVLLVVFLPAVITIWNLFDAHQSARKANSTQFEQARKQSKDPWLAVFLSTFLPGLGHAYLGKWISAILFFLVFLALSALGSSEKLAQIIVFLMVMSVFTGIVTYHTYVTAPVQRDRSRNRILQISTLIALGALASVALSTSVRSFVAEARYIPSGSMIPTLIQNDRLLIDKLIYRFQTPQRTDIVVFSPTEALIQQNFRDAFIKRIIGLPNETLEIKDKKVLINGVPLQESYIAEPPAYQYGPVKIPPDSYFMLGDNRNNAYDSHYWGFVPRRLIIGKATKIFWPLDRIGPIR